MTQDLNLPPHGRPARKQASKRPEPSPMLPCLVCKKPTHRATLSQFGARCVACFEAYCKGEKPNAA